MDRVKGKSAIVTGAAGGLGRAIATLLAAEGAAVTVTDVNEAVGREVAAEIKSSGGRAIFIKHDVSSENDWRRVIEKTVAEFGKLDVLVNNAGVMIVTKIEDMTLEEWRRLMSVNLDGVFLGTKHAVPAMRKGGGGSIINMSSAAGIIGTADNTAAYSASKGGVRLFTKSCALEFSKAGHDYSIRVNSVHPGVIDTPMVAAMRQPGVVGDGMLNIMPVGGLGKPIDIAYGVLYLASDESRLVTGAELVIDGGWTAG
jgi:3(or 17)beta-hydroxysteroid dehydrogenase